MRLIDADALKMNKYHSTTTYENAVAVAYIDNATTIAAIPVEWLIDRANDPKRAPFYRRYAQMLYEEWQKEQETRNEPKV